jgi:hypothetical protein
MTVYDDPVVCTTAGALPADMVPKATASAHSIAATSSDADRRWMPRLRKAMVVPILRPYPGHRGA